MKKSLVLLGCVPCVLWAAMADHFSSQGAYIRANPPARSTTAAYMQAQNTGDAPIIITGVHSPIARKVQIHETVVDDQHVMHMDHMQVLEIPAQSTVDLAPGGKHLMLFNVVEDLRSGTDAIITFDFQDGSKASVTMPVQAIN